MNELDDINPDDVESLSNFIDSLEDNDNEINYRMIMENFGLDIPDLEREMSEYLPKLDLIYSKSDENATSPKYAYNTDSGFDLHSTKDLVIPPFDRDLVPTGIHIDIPDGHEIQVRSKSGLALKQGLMVLNSPGTVDQGYTGEIQVILFNTTKNNVKIEKGQKIAQAVLCPVVSGKWINLVEKNKINLKDRNENGFGSTGI